MPAIRYLPDWAQPTDRRPDASRHIACLPNRQRLRQRWSRSRDVMQDAGEDSAARTAADDARILRDCPCGANPLRNEDVSRQVPSQCARFSVPYLAAITAQQSCSNNDDKRLIG